MRAEGSSHLLTDGACHLIGLATNGGPKGDEQIGAPGSGLLEQPNGPLQNLPCNPPPSGMAGGNSAGMGIGNQHWRAIGTADPKTLPPFIADQAVGLRPGFAKGLSGP